LAAALAGCSGWQSALDPHGPHAARIAELLWIFIAVCTAIWLAVCVVLVWAIRRRRGAERPDPLDLAPARERRLGQLIMGLGMATAIVVIAFAVISFLAQRNLQAAASDELTIHVMGHQWWWEVTYEDPEPARSFITANEIHLPVGVPAKVVLETNDVIHSFWIPSLAGKMDQISGHTNEQELIASRPGVYRGQCAEFCGQSHAKMALLVIASPSDEFEAWRNAQISAAGSPNDPVRQQGLSVFKARGCMLCHSVRGTNAGGNLGPDLTHLASRKTIAAGTAALEPGTLAGWIADPQHMKPGAQMPNIDLTGAELNAVVSYLMGLK
jgi:cytochrome c oxidase subunit II